MVASGTLCLIILFVGWILNFQFIGTGYTAKIGCHRKVTNFYVFLNKINTLQKDLSVVWVLEMHTY